MNAPVPAPSLPGGGCHAPPGLGPLAGARVLPLQSELPSRAGAPVLMLADRCLELLDSMDNFAGGRRRAALLAHPAFVVLVREFASRFELLVAAVDALHVAHLPWRHLIASARLRAALEAGSVAEKRSLEARALDKYLASES